MISIPLFGFLIYIFSEVDVDAAETFIQSVRWLVGTNRMHAEELLGIEQR